MNKYSLATEQRIGKKVHTNFNNTLLHLKLFGTH